MSSDSADPDSSPSPVLQSSSPKLSRSYVTVIAAATSTGEDMGLRNRSTASAEPGEVTMKTKMDTSSRVPFYFIAF